MSERYNKLNALTAELYDCQCHTCSQLKAGNKPNKPQIAFERFKKAYKTLWKKREMTPNMLTLPPIRDAIGATDEVLQEAATPALKADTMPTAMKQKLKEDIFIFSGFKTYHTLKEASLLLRDEYGKVKPFAQFAKDIQAIHDRYNRNYLEAEYLFATQSARMAARWAEDSADAHRYDLQYRTAGDDRVRLDHRALDGITLPADNPFWSEYYPPNGWRCRCNAVRVRRGKYEPTDTNRAIAAGQEATEGKNKIFRFNPGRDRIIFPKQHPYYGKQGYGHCLIEDSQDLAAKMENNEVCKVYALLVKENKIQYDADGYANIPTVNGEVRIHKNVKGNERENNIKTAKYLADKYGYKIELRPQIDEQKSPDSYNYSLSRDEEYKHISKQTENAIDMALKNGHKQADYLVLWLDKNIESKVVKEIVNNRLNRHENLKEIMIINDGLDDFIISRD